jgi:simple sugar transport system ATP-binding protein
VILNGPTVGVDVGSKDEIHGIIEDMSAAGAGVLLVSDDADELIRLCDRLLVMSRGIIARELAGSEISRARRAQFAVED